MVTILVIPSLPFLTIGTLMLFMFWIFINSWLFSSKLELFTGLPCLSILLHLLRTVITFALGRILNIFGRIAKTSNCPQHSMWVLQWFMTSSSILCCLLKYLIKWSLLAYMISNQILIIDSLKNLIESVLNISVSFCAVHWIILSIIINKDI